MKRILKKGTKNNNQFYQKKCRFCGCKYIYEDKDIEFDMDFDYVVCPQCESVNPIIWKRKYRGGNSKNGKFI